MTYKKKTKQHLIQINKPTNTHFNTVYQFS